MNLSAGTVYVDVKLSGIERLEKDVKQIFEKHGITAGKALGEKTSQEFEKSFKDKMKPLGQRAGSDLIESLYQSVEKLGPIVQTGIVTGLVAAAIAAAPLVGSAIGGGITAVLTSGVVGAGIALSFQDPLISTAAKSLGEQIKLSLVAAATPFKAPVLQAIQDISNAFIRLQPTFVALFAATAPFVSLLNKGLVTAIEAVISGLTQLSQKAGPIMAVLSGGIAAIGKEVGDLFRKFASDPIAMEGFRQGLKDIITVAVGLIKIIGDVIIFLSKLYLVVKEVWRGIASTVSGAWSAIRSVFSAIMSGVRTVEGVFSSARNTIAGALNAIKNTVASAFGGLPAQMFSAGKAAIQGFLSGFSSLVGAVLGRARELANEVVSTIKGALDIHSPSRVMLALGMMTGLGFSMGLDASMPDLTKAMQFRAPSAVAMDWGSAREPLFDGPTGFGGPAVVVEHAEITDRQDAWRFGEDLYYLLQARG